MEDAAAIRELEALGAMTTPVVRIGDEVVVGFDRARLSALLSIGLSPAPADPCCAGRSDCKRRKR